MKSSTFKLSVGLVGFLQHKVPADCEPTRALVGLTEKPVKPDRQARPKPGRQGRRPRRLDRRRCSRQPPSACPARARQSPTSDRQKIFAHRPQANLVNSGAKVTAPISASPTTTFLPTSSLPTSVDKPFFCNFPSLTVQIAEDNYQLAPGPTMPGTSSQISYKAKCTTLRRSDQHRKSGVQVVGFGERSPKSALINGNLLGITCGAQCWSVSGAPSL